MGTCGAVASPIPFWTFAIVSTLGRVPGTFISSYVGAHVAEHQYIYALLLLAIVVALSLPLYYYRQRIVGYFHSLRPRGSKGLTDADRDP